MKLISKQKQIPNGYFFYLAPLKWRSTPFQSFNQIVQGALGAIKANPAIAQKQGWPTTYEGVADMVENFQCAICKANGWTEFYTEGGPGGAPSLPFPHRPGMLQSVGRLVVGVRTIADMFGPEGPTTADVAEKRAAVCATCPLNDKGDWTRFFTVPASNSIREALSVFEGTKLKTSFDDELKLCTACGCPVKLKVFARIDHVLKHMPDESKAALDPRCWVLEEEKNEKKV